VVLILIFNPKSMTLVVSKKQVGGLVLSMILSAALFLPHVSHAQLGLDQAKDAATVANNGTTPQSDPATIVGKVIQAVISLIGIIFIVLTVYAGFLWMTARGEPAQVDKSKKLLVQSVIGLAIVLAAYAITQFVLSRLIDATSA